jgi:hypothetical protein
MSVVVRWGASTLAVERLEPLRAAAWLDEVVAIELDADGAWVRCGAAVRPIRPGDRFTLREGDVAVDVDARPDEAQAWAPEVDGRKAGAHLFSLGVHAALLAILFVLRPAVTEEVDLDALRQQLHLPTFEDRLVAEADDAAGGAEAGGKRAELASSAGPGASFDAAWGSRHVVQAGESARGAREAPRTTSADPSTFGIISVITAAHENGPGFADPWVGAGLDAGSSWGDPLGTGEGIGGLSLSGIGEGGGGSKGMGVPLGGLGFGGAGIGASCDDGCVGTGLGGHGTTGQGAHTARPPRIRLCGSSNPEAPKSPCVQTSGRLPPQVIQRIVHQNFGRFRLCYEDSLRLQPSLTTRVSVSFVIGRDGSVSSVNGSGDDAKLAKCVTRSFYALSFPQPEGGVVKVTYPITFSPEG